MSSERVRIIKAWADVGSHDGIFVFSGGPVHSMYGPLMHIWSHKISADLVPIEIHVPKKRWLKLRAAEPGKLQEMNG